MNDKLFYDRMDYVYKNYVKAGKPIPFTRSADVFLNDNVKIGEWFYTNRKKIESLALDGNKEALALINGTAQMIKLKERIDYVFDNYTINDKFVSSSDSFPDGVKIKYWFRRMEIVLQKMAYDGNKKALEVVETFSLKRPSKGEKKEKTSENLNYIFELILFVLYEDKIPTLNDKFSDGTSMGKYMMHNREFIYEGESNDYIGVLNVLIRQKEPDYFNDLEVEREIKEYKKKRGK